MPSNSADPSEDRREAGVLPFFQNKFQPASKISETIRDESLLKSLADNFNIPTQVLWDFYDVLDRDFLVGPPVEDYSDKQKRKIASILQNEKKPILFKAEGKFLFVTTSGKFFETSVSEEVETPKFKLTKSENSEVINVVTAEKSKFLSSFPYALALIRTLNPSFDEGSTPNKYSAAALIRLRRTLKDHPEEAMHFLTIGPNEVTPTLFRRFFDLASLTAELTGTPQTLKYSRDRYASFAVVRPGTSASEAAEGALSREIAYFSWIDKMAANILGQLEKCSEVSERLSDPTSQLAELARRRDEAIEELETLDFTDSLTLLNWLGKFDSIAEDTYEQFTHSSSGPDLIGAIIEKIDVPDKFSDIDHRFMYPWHQIHFPFLRLGHIIKKFSEQGFEESIMRDGQVDHAFQEEQDLNIATRQVLVPNFLGDLFFNGRPKHHSYSDIAAVLTDRFEGQHP